jgi:hypothetical protein
VLFEHGPEAAYVVPIVVRKNNVPDLPRIDPEFANVIQEHFGITESIEKDIFPYQERDPPSPNEPVPLA